jgi:hypothetical protein
VRTAHLTSFFVGCALRTLLLLTYQKPRFSKKPGFLTPQMASVPARRLDKTILNDLPPIV